MIRLYIYMWNKTIISVKFIKLNMFQQQLWKWKSNVTLSREGVRQRAAMRDS